ncbi:hypothetical protein [Marivita sp. GX14005]|uniref:hypothetical protein n=1 Tax=Marivita sp. GX14005 TaxID=2942276 RepID=UPI0020193499|nr:hypothetical protein [Marivita sp. GX14005]MCL3883668.1 hypothetical protein [Marivita sp. GX14005]
MMLIYLRRSLPALMLAGIGTSVAMAGPPRYDVDTHCTTIAEFGGTYSAEMYNYCVESEQSAYNALKPQWDTLPAQVQAHCNKIASFGTPSYEMLEYCVKEEMSASANPPVFKY